MDNFDKQRIEDFYLSDEFQRAHLHIETDSPWKVQKLVPFLDLFAQRDQSRSLVLLDVGGGSGLILRDLSGYLTTNYGREVTQMALELSPGYLELQKKNNPGLKTVFHCSVESAPLKDKEVDLVLMIDVLEHLFDTKTSLRELRRIARYVLFKVPLERNLTVLLMDMLTGYKKKRASSEGIGHVNFYSMESLKKEIEEYLGTVIAASYTDVFSYLLDSRERRKNLSWPKIIYCHIARLCYKISPRITSLIFNDFMIVLVKCHDR